MNSASDNESDQLDAVISTLKDDEDMGVSDSGSESETIEAEAQEKTLPGPPKGAPPPRKALPGPPRSAAPRPRKDQEEDPESFVNQNKVYYSKFSDSESDMFSDLLNATDSVWGKRALKGLFGLVVAGCVGFGVAMFALGVQNWHLPCDMSLSVLLVAMGLLSVVLAGLVVMMIASDGELARVFMIASLVTGNLYLIFLMLDTLMVYGAFSDAFSATCDASGQLDFATEMVEASWAVVGTVSVLGGIRQMLRSARKNQEDSDYARLEMEGVGAV
jgi:hypothetical protein